MPLFSLDIEKELGAETWTNRYILRASSLANTTTAATNIVAAERAIHRAQVLFTRYRVSDVVPLTDIYQIVQINQPGIAPADLQILPLFNVVRCDFTTVSGGRPSRKYLRLPITESNVDLGVFTSAFVTFVQTNYVNALVAIPEYVDVDDQAFSAGSVYPRVGMRQLRRGSKRKAVPVLG